MINIDNFDNQSYANSILVVKPSGSISDDIINDLCMENGKSIAELLDDQQSKTNDPTIE